MPLLEYNLHTSYFKLLPNLVIFLVATMLSWVIEEWNDANFRFLALLASKLGFLYFQIKEIALLLKLFSRITLFNCV